MNTKHIITIEQITDYLTKMPIQYLLAASHGEKSNKTLHYEIQLGTDDGRVIQKSIGYIVRDHREIVLDTGMLDVAIHKYNELP